METSAASPCLFDRGEAVFCAPKRTKKTVFERRQSFSITGCIADRPPGLLSDAEIVLHMSDTLGTNISALIVHNVCGASAENTGGLIFSEHNHIVVGKYLKKILI